MQATHTLGRDSGHVVAGAPVVVIEGLRRTDGLCCGAIVDEDDGSLCGSFWVEETALVAK